MLLILVRRVRIVVQNPLALANLRVHGVTIILSARAQISVFAILLRGVAFVYIIA